MSIEEALAANTAALIENTAAHAKLAEVATAAASGKPATSGAKDKPADDETPKETAAEKKKRLAAEKKAKEAETETEAPKLAASVTAAALKKAAGAFLQSDDEEERDANKANFIGALSHLGAKKLGDVDSGEDRARLAGYIAYWNAGLDVDFEAIDGLLAGEEEEEDILG